MMINKLLISLVMGTTITGGIATTWIEVSGKTKKPTPNKKIVKKPNSDISQTETLPQPPSTEINKLTISTTSTPTIKNTIDTSQQNQKPIPTIKILPEKKEKKPEQTSVIQSSTKPQIPNPPKTPQSKAAEVYSLPKTKIQIFLEQQRIKREREDKHDVFLTKLEEKLNHVSDTSLAEHKQSFSQALNSNKYPNVVHAKLGNNYIVTMKGVQPIKQSDITQHASRGNIVRHKPTHKYFDINKNMDGNDDLLCAGITAANQIYFWLRKNETNILKYINSLKGTSDALTQQQESNLLQLINWAKTGKGEELLLSKWIAKRFGGGFADLDTIFGWFFWGSIFTKIPKLGFFRTMFNKVYKPTHYVPERRTSGADKDLENYPPIYMRKYMTKKSHKDYYSKFLKEAFSKGVPMSFSWTNINSRSPHVTTAWQAEFDDQGNVQAIWISDSDDVWEDERTIGLRKMYFYSYNNKLMVSEHTWEKARGGRILTGMDYLNIEDNIFEQYFRN